MQNSLRWLTASLLSLTFLSCAKQDLTPSSPAAAITTQQDVSSAGFPESFDTGTKTAYTTGSVTLGSGSWTLNDALLGNTTADHKTGAQSVRVRNVGTVGMNFNATTGAGVVTVQHAVYGTDGSSQWELWVSQNSGSSYTKVGSTITSSSTALNTASFTVNLSGNIRLQIRKTSGGTNRINFDNVTLEQYGSGTTTPPPTTGGKKFLFDGSHAELAGNADWVLDVDNGVAVRYPSPAQSGITSSTPETYWTGAISAWGVALVKLGHSVEQLPAGAAITYGNSSNVQDLSNYSVFVVDEPNTVFSAAEKTAILQFVQNGGGLFMISDHDISDRNNDGWDSPAIWNDLMQNNSVKANPFGFSVNLDNVVENSTNALTTSTNPIMNGSQGKVTQLSYHNGATMTLNPTANSTVQGLIWRTSATQGNNSVMAASSTFGTGRVVIIGDSSPADDGTGSPGNTVYDGWNENVSHARLHLNASLWLAKLQ
ncbi:hydrolase [Hymenobacter taeanensis]|uniref:Hydrolase n=1 Tax=Hymenobacter taeanensis TaxID=2735321 RepID=A0A6M6BHN4_9BACT|nr:MULTISPECIES: hydrolase [Hymenobacter]QJX46783.1 hydrolase [Hymenobacter taeanensis]UOQ80652.1 hydrolase [Hymenobacter sp. 5414T-23]